MGLLWHPENANKILNEVTLNDRRCTSDLSILIQPDKGRNFGDVAYFKCIDGLDISSAENLARIQFYKPMYVKHNNSYRLGDLILSSRQKKLLMELLNRPYTKSVNHSILPDWTIWQETIYQFDKSLDYTPEQIITGKGIKTGDFNFVPLDLPIPNYKDLPRKY